MKADKGIKFEDKEEASMRAVRSLWSGFITHLHIYRNITACIHRLMRPGDIDCNVIGPLYY